MFCEIANNVMLPCRAVINVVVSTGLTLIQFTCAAGHVHCTIRSCDDQCSLGQKL